MAVIQIQIGKNTIKYVLLDGGFGINIIIKQLRLRLRLVKNIIQFSSQKLVNVIYIHQKDE
jgi:hypothetical protein